MRDPNTNTMIGRLKRRADFLRAAKGKRFHVGAMTVQASPAQTPIQGEDARNVALPPYARVGFTLTRKVGNAVIRNRARRRLKEAVRLTSDLPVMAAHDYVIVGRIDAIRLPFETLQRDLVRAIRGVHDAGRQRSHEHRPKRTRPQP